MNMNESPQKILISDLPDNVIDGILMCLPLKQAGKTSVLSTSWKYKWAKLPQLIFDDTYFPRSSRFYRDRLTSIYEVLLLHHAPIRKFSLAFSRLRSCPEINKLLQFVFRHGIEELTLEISDGDRHPLPVGIFSCQQLKHLQLHRCDLRPPMTWKGFPKLISLELYGADVVDFSINTFIMLCPQLELLKLLDSVFLSSLEIHAPNLRHVHITGHLTAVSFKDAHKLVDATFKFSTHRTVSTIEELFSGLLSIQRLNMCSLRSFLIAELDLMKSPTILYALKHLHLGRVRFLVAPDISCSLWLIRNSPSLKSIDFESYTGSSSGDGSQAVELLKAEESHNVSLNHLQEVNMKKISGNVAELEFIKYLLAKSPNLKKYYIAPVEAVGVQGKLDMLAKISEFQRASPRAEIKFI